MLRRAADGAAPRRATSRTMVGREDRRAAIGRGLGGHRALPAADRLPDELGDARAGSRARRRRPPGRMLVGHARAGRAAACARRTGTARRLPVRVWSWRTRESTNGEDAKAGDAAAFWHSFAAGRSVILAASASHSSPPMTTLRERLTVAATLPDDRAHALLVGPRVRARASTAPCWSACAATTSSTCPRSRRRRARSCNLADPAAAIRARRRAAAHRAARGRARQLRRGRARSRGAVAARAVRPAGDQGGGRHVRREHARARDRGAGARRPGEGRERAAARSSRSSATTCRACARARPRPRA